MTDESDQMMLLLQELAVLKESKKKTPELQRRKAEIKREMKKLAREKKIAPSE
jgi:hypothetical protein